MLRHARTAAISLSTAWRSLKRRPGYFAIAVSSLAIALGLATTVIAHVDSLIHPDLAVTDQQTLYLGFVGGSVRNPVPDSELVARFSAIPHVKRAAVIRQTSGRTLVSAGSVSGEAWNVWHAGRDAFDLAGARPLRGRWFFSSEGEGTPVALVDEEMWYREFRHAEDLSSIQLTVGGIRHTVVGVIPRAFPLFSIQRMRSDDDSGGSEFPGYIVLPPKAHYDISDFLNARMLVRTTAGARDTVLAVAARRIAEAMRGQYGFPEGTLRGDNNSLRINANLRPIMAGLQFFRVDGYQKAMLLAAAIIVIIACANVSALMLARAVAKRRDQALRLALGAGRRHLMQDVAAEITIVAMAGATFGVVMGYWSMRILAALTPPDLPWLGFREPHWSPWVFAGLFGTVLLAVAIASIVPATFVSSIAPVEQLKDNSGTTTGRPRRTFQVLVVAELALSLVLLFGAVLVAKSADEVAGFNFGYEPRGLTTVFANVLTNERQMCTVGTLRTDAAQVGRVRRCPAEIRFSHADDIVARIRREPGVANAMWTRGGSTRDVLVADESQAIDRQLLNPVEYYAGPGFFRTLGIPILAGRDFVETDRMGNGGVILDELAVRQLFPEGNAVGKLVKFGTAKRQSTWIPVVGVVRSVIHELPADPSVDIKPVVYLATPRFGYGVGFVVRADRGVSDITPRVASIVRDMLPVEVSQRTGPWLQRYDKMLTTRRFTAGMFLTLSLSSLALACAGLFGVLSYTVNQRMREFAVRVALGAQRGHVVKLVLTDGFVMALAGTAIGAGIGLKAAFVLWEWLWGVYPVDAQALIIAEGTLLTITGLGAILPCLRATRANPVDVMRAT